jgi:uncharacterized membrane-anchored protein
MPLLIFTIFIQLIVPAYFVFEKYDTLRTGEEYKFEVELYDPYDAFRGRYVAIQTIAQRSMYERYDSSGLNLSSKYGLVSVDDDGFAYISSVTDTKPNSSEYIKSASSNYFNMPVERYYTDEDIAPQLEQFLFNKKKKVSPYIILRVKDGNVVIQGLYIDGVRIEEYLLNNSD